VKYLYPQKKTEKIFFIFSNAGQEKSPAPPLSQSLNFFSPQPRLDWECKGIIRNYICKELMQKYFKKPVLFL
jgi:hypothetical protein